MREITILDTTLRDGCQAPGFALSPEEKLLFALQLEKLGVDIIEAGFPSSSEAECRSVEMISSEVKAPIISVMARSRDKDIAAAAKSLKYARHGMIHLSLATSPLHREFKLGKTRPELIQMATRSVRSARNYFEFVEIGAEDAVRTETAFLLEYYSAVIDAGADIINITDTVGYAQPEEFSGLVGAVIEKCVKPSGKKVRVSVHCHNDLGFATANTIAGLSAGAAQAEVTVNGIGERAGNAALEEVILAVCVRKDLYNFKFGNINLRELAPSSRLLTRLTATAPSPNKAVVGWNAFKHGSGIHQQGIVEHAGCYSVMRPEEIGMEGNRVVLSVFSGKRGLKKTVSDILSVDLDQKTIEKIFPDYKKFAAGKKSISCGLFLEWLSSVGVISGPCYYELTGHHYRYSAGKGYLLRARLTRYPEKKTITLKGRGRSLAAAIQELFRKVLNKDPQAVDYTTSDSSTGESSLTKSHLRLKFEDETYESEFIHPETCASMMECYLDVVNRIIQRKAKNE